MFVLITYDVNITSPHGEKRLRNVARVCLATWKVNFCLKCSSICIT